MTPEELEKLKKEMGKVFVEEFKRVDFRKIVEEVCRKIIKKEGMSWG